MLVMMKSARVNRTVFCTLCNAVLLSLQVLLGPVHVVTTGGQPNNIAGRHFVLQRRAELPVDSVQLSIRHHLSHRYHC